MATAAVRLFVLAAAFATLGSCEERRFSGQYKWAIKVPHGTTVDISCVLMANSTTPLADTTNLAVLAWHAPNGSEIQRTSSSSSSRGRMYVTGESDELLRIEKVEDGDRGVYTCKFRAADGAVRYHKHGLNLNGQLYASPIEQYKQNLIIGGAAAGSMLVFVSFLCLVHTMVDKSKES